MPGLIFRDIFFMHHCSLLVDVIFDEPPWLEGGTFVMSMGIRKKLTVWEISVWCAKPALMGMRSFQGFWAEVSCLNFGFNILRWSN
jgi:hypothetical protein